jgi:hypothetical protein
MLASDDHPLPNSAREAVRQQLALTFQGPYETPVTVAVNGALTSSAWFFLPSGLRDKVFTLHGTLAFALLLAGWMYSDVPSTNVLGPDARRIVSALDDPVMVRRLLYAKNIVLWLLVTPLWAVVAVISGLVNPSLLATLHTVVAIAVLPFGVLCTGLAAGHAQASAVASPVGIYPRRTVFHRSCRIMISVSGSPWRVRSLSGVRSGVCGSAW